MKYSRFTSVLFLTLFGIGTLFLYGCQTPMSVATDAELGVDTLGVATNNASRVPDCRVRVETSPSDNPDSAFIKCWMEVIENCKKDGIYRGGASAIRVGDEFHVYSTC